jgi:hypothetical protein
MILFVNNYLQKWKNKGFSISFLIYFFCVTILALITHIMTMIADFLTLFKTLVGIPEIFHKQTYFFPENFW